MGEETNNLQHVDAALIQVKDIPNLCQHANANLGPKGEVRSNAKYLNHVRSFNQLGE